MSTDHPADDHPESDTEPTIGNAEAEASFAEQEDRESAGSQPADRAFPLAAAEVLQPFQQLIALTQPVLPPAVDLSSIQSVFAAQEGLNRTAQDIAQIGQEITNNSAVRLTQDFERQRSKIVQLGLDASKLSATFSELSNVGASWARLQKQQTERAQQIALSVTSAVDAFLPWIKKAARAVGDKAAEFYRRAAPPNWTVDTTSAVDYVAAVRLSLEEGIPLAWVPDQETIKLLLAVHGTGPSRRTQLYSILDERCEIILDYCDTRLDEIARNSTATRQLQETLRVAHQAVTALRLNLDAAAQSTAANLLDLLLRNASTTVFGDYTHKKAFQRVETLSAEADRTGLSSLMSLGILREMATLMPVLTAMTPWYPSSDTEPPETFSRHVVTHFITAEGQVTRTNALIAVMTAISLISQQQDSHWNSWRTLNALGIGTAAPGPTAETPSPDWGLGMAHGAS